MMSNLGNEFENYDIPKHATPINYDFPKNLCRTPNSSIVPQLRFDTMSLRGCAAPIQEESYDVPRPLNSLLHYQNPLTPSNSNSSLLTRDSLSLSFFSSNRSSLVNVSDYDIPLRNPLPVRLMQYTNPQQNQQVQNGNNSINYDFSLPLTISAPLQENHFSSSLIPVKNTKELPLELPSALEYLAKLQTEATTAISRFLSFVLPHWRLHENLEPVIMEVKLAAVRLRSTLHDLTEFGEGTLGNAARSADRNLSLKLGPLVRALHDADKLIHESCQTLDIQGGWTLDNLAREDKPSCKPPDSLDQLIACVQTLTEDVRQITSFIQGNASLLFKRSNTHVTEDLESSNNTTHNSSVNNTQAEWLEDYDYVSFESKDAAAKKNYALRETFPDNIKKKFDNVIKTAETTAINTSIGPNIVRMNKKNELTNKDKLLVRYYAVQIYTHMGNLRQAIDSFLETVEKNQPPKFFIAYGKFVVVSAHNLVTIGDMVHRNVSKVELREKVLQYTNALADALKTCVSKSKKAASQFPSVTAVQEMVDSIVDISHLAYDLKKSMMHAVQLSI